MNVDVAGNLDADHLAPVGGAAQHKFGGDDLVLEDLPVVIHIVDKQVEGPDPLLETAFHPFPLVGGDHPRHGVERHDPLDPLVPSINGEGDALLAHREVGQAMPAFDIGGIEIGKPVGDVLVVGADGAAIGDHLIPASGLVTIKPGGGVGAAHGQHGEVPGALKPRGVGQLLCQRGPQNGKRDESRHFPHILSNSVACHAFEAP